MKDSMTQFSMCQQHNLQEDVLIRSDKQKSEQKLVCRQCADIFFGNVPAQQVQDSHKELIQIFESQAKQNSMQMNQVIHSLIQIKELLNKKIESLIFEIRNQISNQDDLLKQCKTNILYKGKIQQIHEEYITNLKNFQNNTLKDIEILEEKISFNQNIKLLQELDSSSLNNKIKVFSTKQSSIQNQINLSERRNDLQRYEYQLSTISTIKLSDRCYAIALNKDNSIVVAGVKRIKVFEFKNEQLKEVQELAEFASKLQFIKNSSQFVSINDFQFRIWQQQENNQWVCNCTFVHFPIRICRSIIDEDWIIFINGLQMGQISFYKSQNNKKWILDQEIHNSSHISHLSLNDSNTKLILVTMDFQVHRIERITIDDTILVYEYKECKWCNSQQIKVQNGKKSLCFIGENEFIYLPKSSQDLYMYSCNNANKQFEKVNIIQIENITSDNYYSLQFIKSKKILMLINKKFVHIVRQENNKFILDQSIQFNAQQTQVSISDDGQCLLTWDEESCELQVRNLMMIQ